MYNLTPTKWYYPSGASDPVPCRWEGLVTFGTACARTWIVVSLFGE